jgi:hypothetical protein
MNIYEINVPLSLESKSNFDKHNFNSLVELEFEFKNTFENLEYQLVGKDKNYIVIINSLLAENEEECINKVVIFLESLMPTCSLIIQSKNSNQHYTHIKLNYIISQIKITKQTPVAKEEVHGSNQVIKLSDQITMKDHMQITSTISVDFNGLNQLISHYFDDKEFKHILDSYYRALSATDSVTKYYNAFTVIEFIETTFSKDIETNLLIKKESLELMLSTLESGDAANQERIILRIRSTLSSATLESRREKLVSILKEVFNIDSLRSGAVSLVINDEFAKEAINIRNSLFHGQKLSSEREALIFSKGLELILLIENILLNWDRVEKF